METLPDKLRFHGPFAFVDRGRGISVTAEVPIEGLETEVEV